MSIIDIMAAPFAECMILVAIHTYLGIHVLRRRVIFVDLALAQTAALGTSVGFLFGILPDTTAALLFSMTFTTLGAAVFALTRIRSEKVPQEAVIGLFYAIMAALAVLVVQKTAGAEHMSDILVGSILWVKWHDVIAAAIAYGAIGAVHYVFRKPFLLISENPDEAYRQGMRVKAWDFLFYLTFGLVISFSVRVAGVLLVFVFLVAPAIMAFIVTERLKAQLLIGWAMGTVVTTLGLVLSYVGDLPSGPTVVAFYGVVLVAGALAVYLVRAEQRGTALRWVGVGGAVVVVVAFAVYSFGSWLAKTSLSDSVNLPHHHAEEMLQREGAPAKPEKAAANEELKRLRRWLSSRASDVAVSAAKLSAYCSCEDDDERLALIRDALRRKEECALPLLAYFLSCDETPPFFKSEAATLFRNESGVDLGYNPEGNSDANKVAIERLIARFEGKGSQ